MSIRVTDTGQAFYERCRAMLAEAEQVEALVMHAQAEPHGRIRLSCPTGMLQPLSATIASFLDCYPKVRLQLVATDRTVNLIEDRIDLVLRVRASLDSDAALTMRTLGTSTRILVASSQVAGTIGEMGQLTTVPVLATNDAVDDPEWHLEAVDEHKQAMRVTPRFGCEGMAAVRDAAVAGLWVAILPD